MTTVLTIEGLRAGYRTRDGFTEAVQGVDLELGAGEVLAVVGESGSGKSTLAQSVIGLLPGNGAVTGGRILLGSRDITSLGGRAMDQVRGAQIGLVPQDPGVSLNPVHRVGRQIAEVLKVHRLARGEAALARAVEILASVGIPDPEVRARQYPHELSGGLRQRVLIGMALAAGPPLVIADEPTSALDVTVQRVVLDHFARVIAETGTSVLFITHDLAVAADRADRIVVMQGGRIVESGPAAQVLTDPQHEYTKVLLAAAPSLTGTRLIGTVSAPGEGTPSGVVEHEPALEVSDLVKDFPLPGRREPLRAVDSVSFTIPAGSTFALVGESGSGKSTTARMATLLERPTSGQVRIAGRDVTGLRGEALRQLRASVQVVYQNPYASLDPRFSVERIIAEPLRAFRVGSSSERAARVAQLLDQVALHASMASRRPAELSGGQRQRVAIARALALRPDLVVLDEPVSALDVSVQRQILELLVDLQTSLGLSYLFISHDLAVVRQVSNTVGVMWKGRIVEAGATQALFDDPQHEYTRELLEAIPGRGAGAMT
ncbi:dipeptide ABC transporter ATP-binding protein [Occultella kanbiaonis]|uniref:dipeptide ABC transporter ATP-binding protein n=1 Tax=Occultella kanbiaonis TaxID=2675754 RepID=UPI0013D3AFB2|nr:ABC transporter ATP-binding protein [Occultella kanbiaonis]